MTKSTRRGWLDKISKWILDALPGDESQQPAEPLSPIERAKAPAAPPIRSVLAPKPGSAQPAAEPSAPHAPSADAADPDKTLIKAWRAFERAWSAAGLSNQCFLKSEELISTLSVLDQTFEEELIEWLYQLCTKPDALTNLAAIIERGQVKPTDQIDAIRAFAYVSVAVVTRPSAATITQDAPAAIDHENQELIGAGPKRNTERIGATEPDLEGDDTDAETKEQNRTPTTDNKSAIPNQTVEELGLTIRSFNSLKRNGIHTLLDLAGKTRENLFSLKNVGAASVAEVQSVLERLGLEMPFAACEISGIQQSQNAENNKSGFGANSLEEQAAELSQLGLSYRTLSSLYRGKIFTVNEIIRCTESDLLACPNFGQAALEEVRKVLGTKGLTISEETAPAQPLAGPKELPEGSLQTAEEAWQQLRHQALDGYGTEFLDQEQLQSLCENNPDNRSTPQLQELLNRLQAVSGYLTDNLIVDDRSGSSDLALSLRALERLLYGRLLGDSLENAEGAVNRVSRSIGRSSIRAWQIYLQRCSGQTLASIAEQSTPPVTRERIRQMEAKIVKAVGIKPTALVDSIKDAQSAQAAATELQAIKNWLTRYRRLPVRDDEQSPEEENTELWEMVVELNLKERIDLLAKHNLGLTPEEYDYHYLYVSSRIGSVGTGYWRDFENLKQFVVRHAAALGAPQVMPNQTSFPDSVRGVITSYGGQSKVAKKIGLDYHGQLVGEDGGRTYWTDAKLAGLLVDVNTHLGIPEQIMPSYGQVLQFFKETNEPVYQTKKPHSAIAALTKMGKLQWIEVAKRFNKRFVPGESQKAITISYIKAFVRDLGEHLDSLTPSELFVLFQAQGINRGEREKFSRTFDALVDAVQSGMVDKDQLRSWADDHQVEAVNELLELGSELKEEANLEKREQLLLERRSQKLQADFADSEATSDVSVEDLPNLEPKAVLKALDKAAELLESSSSDEDKVEFLKSKATAKLWDACFRDEQSLIARLRSFETSSDTYSYEVQQAFLEEYDGARALEIPTSYAFRDLKGIPREPKLMQRLVAYRLERDLRLLNLSGTGTGKTLSAVFAAQICASQRILITCPNGVIESWKRCFESAFPSATLHIKPDSWDIDELADGVNVVIVNHERFQDRFAQELLGFCIGYRADLIVIDEIHKSKRRTTDTSSQRRKLMNEFIRISINLNPDLRVLGLSATPVINNLYEGQSLIELICQESLDGVGEKVDLTACMNLYQHFVVKGIRMNPGKMPRTEILQHDVDATPLLPQIVRATKKGSFHDIEQLLVAPKINSLSGMLQRGSKTVIFITYVKNTLKPICSWLASNQFSYSVFTGDEKEAQEEGFRDSLDEFIRGGSEVLVATIQCAGTGIDGLQSVCNRAIFFQLPWTSTEFEQAIGRLDRDGTDFDSVHVHIPITDVALPDGKRWSWCRSKLDRIESKRDIAKAAVDGEIPDAATLISPSQASTYWLKWLEKLDHASQTSSPS